MQVWLSHINQEKHSGVVVQLRKLSVSVFIAISVKDTLLFRLIGSQVLVIKVPLKIPPPSFFFHFKVKLNLKVGWYLIVLFSLWIQTLCYSKEFHQLVDGWLVEYCLTDRPFPNIIMQLYLQTTIRKKYFWRKKNMQEQFFFMSSIIFHSICAKFAQFLRKQFSSIIYKVVCEMSSIKIFKLHLIFRARA